MHAIVIQIHVDFGNKSTCASSVREKNGRKHFFHFFHFLKFRFVWIHFPSEEELSRQDMPLLTTRTGKGFSLFQNIG